MKARPRPVKLKLYPILSRAVDEGIAAGWRRAHKHTDTPGEGTISQEIYNHVMNGLSELFVWDD